MKKFLDKLGSEVDKLLKAKVNLLAWAMGFLGIIGIRALIEEIIMPVSDTFAGAIISYLHYLLFFLILFMIIWSILVLFLRIKPVKLAFVILAAAWLIVLPPILDMLKTGGQIFWSFYLLESVQGLFGEFITFFGRLPSGIAYFGTKILFFSAVALVGLFVLIKTRNSLKFLGSLLASYASLFFLASFPSWAAYAYYFFAEKRPITSIKSYQVVQFGAAPRQVFGLEAVDMKYAFAYNFNSFYFLWLLILLGILFLAINKQKVVAVVKNARPPQLIYHAGLFGIGLGLGYLAYPSHFNVNIVSFFIILDLLASIGLAWLTSVIVNDIYDFEIDAVSNPERPLQQGIFGKAEYLELGTLFFGLSVLGGLVVDVKFALLLFFYQFLAWAYSAPPFRLKKFPGIATFISALASLLVLLIGFFLFSGNQNIVGLSWRVIILLLAALTLSLPIKDFKDVAGDKKYQIWTIPVLFREETSRLIVAVGVFISFMLSVFMLNEFRLFWWALLSGIIAFLTVINKKPRQLFWWVLGVVAIYGVILVKILFL